MLLCMYRVCTDGGESPLSGRRRTVRVTVTVTVAVSVRKSVQQRRSPGMSPVSQNGQDECHVSPRTPIHTCLALFLSLSQASRQGKQHEEIKPGSPLAHEQPDKTPSFELSLTLKHPVMDPLARTEDDPRFPSGFALGRSAVDSGFYGAL